MPCDNCGGFPVVITRLGPKRCPACSGTGNASTHAHQ